MKIGIIDAEIIGAKKHRFPNLVCMKLSSYHKQLGDSVKLLLSYSDVDEYDRVYISKVFIKTCIPGEENPSEKNETNCEEYYKRNKFLQNPKIVYGGTGFYYANAPKLADEIEHIMPDYHLYDEWVEECVRGGAGREEFKYYLEYSIGFLTRGCFRKCQHCVNRVYDRCCAHSNLSEFFDESRPKMCFLDDNFFACSNWRDIIKEVIATGKRFQFKQGLDERLLTEEKVKELASWKYDGDIIFAFDNIEDRDLIESKLRLIYDVCPDMKKRLKFYVFTGFDRNEKYDEEFWRTDIINLVERAIILSKYSAVPYVMRHENYRLSPYVGFYNAIASWCNQPQFFKTFSLEEFCKCRGMSSCGYKKYKKDTDGYLKEFGNKKNAKGSSWRCFDKYIADNGDNKLFHIIPKYNAKYGPDARRE